MAIFVMMSASIFWGFLIVNTILLRTNTFSPFASSIFGVSNTCRVNLGLSMSETNDTIHNIVVATHVDHR